MKHIFPSAIRQILLKAECFSALLLFVNIFFPSLWEGAGMNCFSQPIRNWGTYYGAAECDNGAFSAVDASGNVYIVGSTISPTGLSTPGSHQPALKGGCDAFLVKFNSAGVRLWATYYGGLGDDKGTSVAVDANGNVYISGYTNSGTASGSPFGTAGSHQPTHGGGYLDAFLVKFSPSGTRLWATYYGGTANDEGLAVTVDAGGNVYLAGRTYSSAGISTSGSHQPVIATTTGSYTAGDAFLVKFNSAGVRQWGTYYGGAIATIAGGVNDYATCVAVDAIGNVYISGITGSSTDISTSGSHQPVHGGGYRDAFLVKFTASGLRLWATYYGGPGDEDYVSSVAVDAAGNVYLAGSTTSLAGISTSGSHQSLFGGYVMDAFLVQFSASGLRLWATYCGGTGGDYGNSVAVDGCGNVYLAGSTTSLAGISTSGSHQPVFAGVTPYYQEDAFLVQFSASGIRQWGTYYGGGEGDIGYAVAVDASGNVYLAGTTSSTKGISTAGSFQPTLGGITFQGMGSKKCGDAFLAQFKGCAGSAGVTATGADICPGYCATVTANPAGGTAPFTYSWSPSAQVSQSAVVCPSSTTVYSVTITDATGTTATDTALVTIKPASSCCSVSPVISSDPGTTVCVGAQVFISASGGITYSWNTGAASANITVTPSVTTTYSVTVTDASGCTGTGAITVPVDPGCTATGISQLGDASHQLTIWPNPSSGEFWLSIPSGHLSLSPSPIGDGWAEVKIYNVFGEKVYTSPLTPFSHGKGNGGEVINLSSHPSGIYFIHVQTKEKSFMQKLIIHE